MRRNILLISVMATAMVFFAAATVDHAKTEPVTKTYQVRCTNANQSLYFVIYEQNGQLNGGHLYVENMQVATLTATNAGTGVIRAKVNGNTANVGFEIHKPPMNKVLVANYTPGSEKRVEVCQCSYKYQ